MMILISIALLIVGISIGIKLSLFIQGLIAIVLVGLLFRKNETFLGSAGVGVFLIIVILLIGILFGDLMYFIFYYPSIPDNVVTNFKDILLWPLKP